MSLRSAGVATLALAALLLSSCAFSSPPPKSGPGGGPGDALLFVDRALTAQGGTDAVAGLSAVRVQGSGTWWDPEQSPKPGGEPRLGGEASFVAVRDVRAGTARIEWVKRYAYPAPRENRFTEIVTPAAGAVLGIDSISRTKQDQGMDPPRHTMSGVRLAVAQRELLRSSPRLLAELWEHPSQVTRVPDVTIDGVRHPAVSYRAGDVTLVVLFDPATALPARVRTLDADSIGGDSIYDLVLSDWRRVGQVQIAHALRYELAGTVTAKIQLEQVTAGTPAPPGSFDVPPELAANAPRPATGAVPYQWVLERQSIGIYLDSDAVHYDPQASGGLKLVDLAEGVSQVQGGTHNSLVVELADGLAVMDAPLDVNQSRFTIDAAKARYPGKPIRWLVLSHHHADHAGGLRAYVAEGATLVVGAGAGAYYLHVLAVPDRLSGGVLADHPRKPQILEVPDRTVLGTEPRTLELFRIENPHVDPMLMGYVPQARLGFVVDIWSPGREKLGTTLTPGQAALVAAVRKAGISPERFAGGHGSVADYAPLEALAGK